MYVYRNIVAPSRDYRYSGNATVHYARIVEIHATVTCVKYCALHSITFMPDLCRRQQ